MGSVGNDEDVFRDTPVRYLGYANEVGEAFRAILPVNVVRLSYAVACGYVIADAVHKGALAGKYSWPTKNQRRQKISQAVMDTVIWQGLASVAIPGFTINRLCYLSTRILSKVLLSIPSVNKKYLVTAVGLAAIPFIVKPIDNSVDFMMNNTVRKMYHISEVMEHKIVHHTRRE